MPALTRLTRDVDRVVGTWRDPKTGVTMEAEVAWTVDEFWDWVELPGPITTWPPKPATIPASYTYVGLGLRGRFTNGATAIGPNEIGNVSWWQHRGQKVSEDFMAIIQEPGDDPVEVMVPAKSLTTDRDGKLSTARAIEAKTPNAAGRLPSYRIVNDMAIKEGER